MASIIQDITLGHCPTTSSSPEEINLAAGTPVTILKEWAHHFLIKTAEGTFYNVKKEAVDASS